MHLFKPCSFFLCGTLGFSHLFAGDWAQYRGPNHDGISTEAIRTNWLETAPRVVWRAPIDPALSSFSISGGKAFTQVRRATGGSDQEFCVALDTETGTELWATPLGIADYPDGGVGSDDGPRSTPSVDNTQVYVLTSYLRMVCLDSATGQEQWSKDLVADLGSQVIAWQNAASPLIVGDLIYLNCNAAGGRLLALRKADGSIAWRGQNDWMTQASPIAATVAGVAQIIFFAQSGLVSVTPDAGAVLWRYPFHFSISTAASPVVAGDMVYCSAAYGIGAGAVKISANGQLLAATQVWKTPGANMNHWATPIFYQGFLYGIYGESLGSLRCVDITNGQEKWRQDGIGLGGILFVQGQILVLAEDGTLILVNPDPTGYSETARFSAVTGKSWNVPAISNGRIYVRSTMEAAAIDVAPQTLPKPKLKLYPGLDPGADIFQLSIAPEDGSPLDGSRSTNIDIFATFDLGAGVAGWTKVMPAPVLTNGQLRLQEPRSGSPPMRFFRAEEHP